MEKSIYDLKPHQHTSIAGGVLVYPLGHADKVEPDENGIVKPSRDNIPTLHFDYNPLSDKEWRDKRLAEISRKMREQPLPEFVTKGEYHRLGACTNPDCSRCFPNS